MNANLVTTWLEAEHEFHQMESSSEALRQMNSDLGTKYSLSMLWAWRHPDRSGRAPNNEARNYMIRRSMPWILKKCGIRATGMTANRIAEALS